MAHRFLIAPLESGLQNNVSSWLIPDDAFQRLDNAYIYKGRIRKRFGSTYTGTATTNLGKQLASRVRVKVGTTDGSGDLAGSVPGAKFKIGQQFSIDTALYTVVTVGAVQDMLQTVATTTATFSTTNGAYAFVGAPATKDVYFYPNEPIMGLAQYEPLSVNDKDTYAFDTQFAYKYSGGSWLRNGTTVWTGSDSNFFWTALWNGANTSDYHLFVTNFNAADPIYDFDGTTWTAFKPKFTMAGAGNYVKTCRLIFPFKDRLILLNTTEANTTDSANLRYPARCRYSHNGVSFPAAPTLLGTTNAAGALSGTVAAPWFVGQKFSIANTVYTVVSAVAGAQSMGKTDGTTTATFNISTGDYVFNGAPINSPVYFYSTGYSPWLEHGEPGWSGGGWIDASTDEEIMSAEFIRDRLIVYFTNSTWELVYTGTATQPFVWQKLNTELGSGSQFSPVSFDTAILNFGTTAIHACTGAFVDRVDAKIPQQIFDVRITDDGFMRVHGVRDFYNELIYWSYPDTDSTKFPNKILVYNYVNKSWAINDDSFTCFGDFNQNDAKTWEAETLTWEEDFDTWESLQGQSFAKQIIAGNQHGFITVINSNIMRNAGSLSIADIKYVGIALQLTIPNHNLQDGDYILIENIIPDMTLNDKIYKISVVDANIVSIGDVILPATYEGGGTAARVSYVAIRSKEWNPYVAKGKNINLERIEFHVDRTDFAQFAIDAYTSTANLNMIKEARLTGTLMGDSILEMFSLSGIENLQERLWRPVDFNLNGEFIQIKIYFNENQMKSVQVALSPFQIHALMLFTYPTRSF